MSIDKNTKRHDSKSVRVSIEQNRGGKDAIHRILDAYGFESRQALCNHLGISQSTMANRYARDTFPSDWIIICNIETGASLIWLTTGKGTPFLEPEKSQVESVEYFKITNGVLVKIDDYIFDAKYLPENLLNPSLVSSEGASYLLDEYEGEITDGLWLIEIDKLVSIRELNRFPGGRIRVENGKASFECHASEIKVLGKVLSKTNYME